MSSFHLKRDTDETRARVRKGAARTKSERESSRSRATVSTPLLRPSSKRRREKAFGLFGETRCIRVRQIKRAKREFNVHDPSSTSGKKKTKKRKKWKSEFKFVKMAKISLINATSIRALE